MAQSFRAQSSFLLQQCRCESGMYSALVLVWYTPQNHQQSLGPGPNLLGGLVGGWVKGGWVVWDPPPPQKWCRVVKRRPWGGGGADRTLLGPDDKRELVRKPAKHWATSGTPSSHTTTSGAHREGVRRPDGGTEGQEQAKQPQKRASERSSRAELRRRRWWGGVGDGGMGKRVLGGVSAHRMRSAGTATRSRLAFPGPP